MFPISMDKSRSKRKGISDPVESKRVKDMKPWDELDEDESTTHKVRKAFPLDMVPPELVWEILDWVPEAVPHLLRASRNMRIIVEGFAKKSTKIPLVDYLKCNWMIPTNQMSGSLPGRLVCNITVRKYCWPLLALRMMFRRDSFEITKLSKLIKPETGQPEEISNAFYPFKIAFTIERDEHLKLLELLNESIGKGSCIDRIWMETDIYNDQHFPFDVAAVLLKGIGGRKLKLNLETLDESVYQLLNPTVFRTACYLDIIAKNFEISDKKSFMSQLLTNFRDVSILLLNSANFFGLSDTETAQCILDLFTNGNICDLYLLNFEESVLKKTGLDLLRESIPFLTKKIRLKTNCSGYPEGLNYELNDFHIKADSEGTLLIKHKSLDDYKYDIFDDVHDIDIIR